MRLHVLTMYLRLIQSIFVHLTSKLKKSVSIGRRNLEEKITINEIIELYVPIYEARLIGPKKNVRLMRIDSIRKKVL